MSFDYHEPTSIREAVELGARFGVEGRFLAGGTIALGALVTHRRLERAQAFQGALRALVGSAEVIGGHQIRNVATVGGNVDRDVPRSRR